MNGISPYKEGCCHEEIWRPVVGVSGFLISNLGKVLNCATGDYVPVRVGDPGYIEADCTSPETKVTTKIRIHRSIAMAFIPSIPGKNVVNHKDGNKLNNSLDNLEWVTQKENNIHAFETGLNNRNRLQNFMKGKYGKDHNMSKPVAIVDHNGDIIKSFESIKQAEKLTGLAESTIRRRARGEVRLKSGMEKWIFI